MKTPTNSTVISKKVWANFVHTHPCGNIFQTPEMQEVYLQTKNYEPINITDVDVNGDIIGLLLAVIQKEHSGILGKFTARSIIWAGPLVKNDDLNTLDFILKEYINKIKGKVIYSQFRNIWNWSIEQKRIFEKNGYTYNDHLDVLIDLEKPEDELLMGMHKGRRKNIRRAERCSLNFAETTDVNDFEKCLLLIIETYKKVKMPCPDKTLFSSALKNLTEISNLKIFVLKLHNEIIACRFSLCYGNTIYDWYSGTDEKHLDKYPNDFLIWKILLWAKENNYYTFDFGGAGKPDEPYGVREYKIKFGGNLVNFGRFEKIHKPFLMKLGQFGIVIYKMLNGLR